MFWFTFDLELELDIHWTILWWWIIIIWNYLSYYVWSWLLSEEILCQFMEAYTCTSIWNLFIVLWMWIQQTYFNNSTSVCVDFIYFCILGPVTPWQPPPPPPRYWENNFAFHTFLKKIVSHSPLTLWQFVTENDNEKSQLLWISLLQKKMLHWIYFSALSV